MSSGATTTAATPSAAGLPSVKTVLDTMLYDDAKSVKMKKLAFDLKGFLENSEFAEEFLDMDGLNVLVQMLKTTTGALQGYLLAAARSVLVYENAIETVAESPDLVDRFYNLLSPSENGVVNLNIAKHTLQILIVICGTVKDVGHKMINQAAKQRVGTDVHPYGVLVPLLSCKDLLVARNTLIFMNIMMSARKKASEKKAKKLLFRWKVCGLLSVMKELLHIDDEEIKRQVTVFQKLTDFTIPGSWEEVYQWKKKFEEMKSRYDGVAQKNFVYQQQQAKVRLLNAQMARVEDTCKALALVLPSTSTNYHAAKRFEEGGGIPLNTPLSDVVEPVESKSDPSVAEARTRVLERFLAAPDFKPMIEKTIGKKIGGRRPAGAHVDPFGAYDSEEEDDPRSRFKPPPPPDDAIGPPPDDDELPPPPMDEFDDLPPPPMPDDFADGPPPAFEEEGPPPPAFEEDDVGAAAVAAVPAAAPGGQPPAAGTPPPPPPPAVAGGAPPTPPPAGVPPAPPGKAPPPPPPPPPGFKKGPPPLPGKGPPGLPPGGLFGKSTAPQDTTQWYKGKAPAKKMRPFHWEKYKLQKENLDKSLWGMIHSGKTDCAIDYDEFEAMFSQKEVEAKKKEEKKETKVALIDSKPFQNLSIMLHRLPRIHVIQQALLDLNSDVLTSEGLSAMIAQVPTPEVRKAFIEKCDLKPVEEYEPPEQFVAMTINMTEFKRRCSAWLFTMDWEESVVAVLKPIQRLVAAIDAVLASKQLPYFLGVLLSFGNMMNHGNALKGNAPAFSISTLGKLDAAKDNRGKVSLLQHMLHVVNSRNPEALEVVEELKPIFLNVIGIKMDDLDKSVADAVKELEVFYNQFSAVKKALMDTGASKDDPFVPFMAEFHVRASSQIKEVHVIHEGCHAKFARLLEYFAVPSTKPMKPEEFFGELIPFMEKVKRETAAAAKDRKRQTKRGQKLQGASAGGEDLMSAVVNSLQEQIVQS